MIKKEITEEYEIDVKRFYIPIEHETNCPNCNTKNKANLNAGGYLSYPTLNKKEGVYMCCNECGQEYEFDLTLKMSVEINENLREL